jgi:hypothetical protein
MSNMEFLDIHDGLTVASRYIVALEAVDMGTTAIHVNYGSETRVHYKNVPYSTLKDILLARHKQDSRQIDSTVSRSLEQLAKFQAIQVP